MKPRAKKESRLYFPTGSDLIDLMVGGGLGKGFPCGKIINIVGDKSSGKTFLANEIIAASFYRYKTRLHWRYDDCESGFSFDTEAMYGIEIMPELKEDRIKSATVEELYCNVRDFLEGLKENQLGIYVVDSLDGLSSEEGDKLADERFSAHKKGKEFKQGSYKMGKPKYLSQEFFPQLADLIETKNALLIVISQVRDNIDPMSFDRFARAGGKAMDFYCHTVMWLAQVGKIKRKDRSVGVRIKAKTTKSKTPRPYREIYLSLLFDYGIDNISSNVDFIFDFLTPTGQLTKNASGSWGMEINLTNLKEFLAGNDLEGYYRAEVQPKLKKSEVLYWIKNQVTDFSTCPINFEVIREKFYGNFGTGQPMDRAGLIEYVEKYKLENELSRRTEEKWEEIENSIKTNRPRKYS